MIIKKIEEYMKIFAERLKELRLEKSISRSKLADELFVSERLVCYWENGERECSFEMLIKIADFFGVTIDYILGRTDY
ncbi:MAG: helix-turn-helix domain-containing protein [Clostridia bacterium]|nr:helix-turn-helix domain-containing protein [Clostridia bacterium]